MAGAIVDGNDKYNTNIKGMRMFIIQQQFVRNGETAPRVLYVSSRDAGGNAFFV
jgi:hypothetical protein